MDSLRIWAVFRKELIHVRRDPASLIEAILIPVILLFINGFALNFDLKQIPMAVYDREGSQVSERFIQEFEGTPYFRIHRYVESCKEIARLINERKVKLALVLPHDFSRNLKSENITRIQAIVDGTNANTADLVIGYVQAISSAYSQGLTLERLKLKGLTGIQLPIKSDTRIWYNEELESRNFIVPGLIAIIMTMVGALLTALCIIREKERGTMEGLMGTPLKKSELILGKLGPYFNYRHAGYVHFHGNRQILVRSAPAR